MLKMVIPLSPNEEGISDKKGVPRARVIVTTVFPQACVFRVLSSRIWIPGEPGSRTLIYARERTYIKNAVVQWTGPLETPAFSTWAAKLYNRIFLKGRYLKVILICINQVVCPHMHFTPSD